MDIINNCPQYFAVEMPSILWAERVSRYRSLLSAATFYFCKISAAS